MDAKLSDRISQRRSPSVFAYFYGGDKYFPMMLGARISGDAALIDVARFHGGPGESLLFLNMKRKISSELQSTFGTRVSEVPRGDIVL